MATADEKECKVCGLRLDASPDELHAAVDDLYRGNERLSERVKQLEGELAAAARAQESCSEGMGRAIGERDAAEARAKLLEGENARLNGELEQAKFNIDEAALASQSWARRATAAEADAKRLTRERDSFRHSFEQSAAAPDKPAIPQPLICTCTVTKYERQENRSCPVHFPPQPSSRKDVDAFADGVLAGREAAALLCDAMVHNLEGCTDAVSASSWHSAKLLAQRIRALPPPSGTPSNQVDALRRALVDLLYEVAPNDGTACALCGDKGDPVCCLHVAVARAALDAPLVAPSNREDRDLLLRALAWLLKCETCAPGHPGQMSVLVSVDMSGEIETYELEPCAQCDGEPEKVALRTALEKADAVALREALTKALENGK